MSYVRPKPIKHWKIDNPDEELYESSIMDDQTVIAAYGRYAHGSGCKIVSWQDFLNGEMNELVAKYMGDKVLSQMLAMLRLIT